MQSSVRTEHEVRGNTGNDNSYSQARLQRTMSGKQHQQKEDKQKENDYWERIKRCAEQGSKAGISPPRQE